MGVRPPRPPAVLAAAGPLGLSCWAGPFPLLPPQAGAPAPLGTHSVDVSFGPSGFKHPASATTHQLPPGPQLQVQLATTSGCHLGHRGSQMYHVQSKLLGSLDPLFDGILSLPPGSSLPPLGKIKTKQRTDRGLPSSCCSHAIRPSISTIKMCPGSDHSLPLHCSDPAPSLGIVVASQCSSAPPCCSARSRCQVL